MCNYDLFSYYRRFCAVMDNRLSNHAGTKNNKKCGCMAKSEVKTGRI